MSLRLLGGLVATAFLAASSVGLHAEPGVTDTQITIGNVLPMSSSVAITGRGAHFGSVIAAEEANAAGGVNGRKIVIQTEDDGYVPARTVQGLRKLISDGLFGLIGTGGGAGTSAVLPILEEEKIPSIVAFSPLREAVTPVKKTVFMIGAEYQQLVYAQIKYIHENRIKTGGRYALVRQDDEFGAQIEQAFNRAVTEFKLEALPIIRYKRGQRDFGAEVLTLQSQNANVLVSGAPSIETPAMLKEARRFSMELQTVTVPPTLLSPIMKLIAPTGYKVLSGDYVSPLGSKGAAHFEEQSKKFLQGDDLAAVNRYSLTGYVATRIMIEAIRQCGKDVTRACVVDKMESGQPFDTTGITEPLSFSTTNHLTATKVRVLEVDAVNGVATPLTDFQQY
jgi:branched-chain amino acid transport system substrate-binding protein